MNKKDLLEKIRGKLIVSCQALPGEPLYDPEKTVMSLMARAALQGGAAAIRTNSVRDVKTVKAETGLPVIGLIKIEYEGYEGYITPTMKEVDALAEAGSDVVALDCTDRARGDGLTPPEFLQKIRERHPGIVLMADIATLDEGLAAAEAGADLVGTTMSGYTPQSPKTEGPNYPLIRSLAEKSPVPVIAEGRIHYPEQAREALQLGAFAVVVGGAITRPKEITERFVRAMAEKSSGA